MNLPGGIRVKLAVALLAFVVAALAGAYVMIVPSLERRLVEAKLDELEQATQLSAINLPSSAALFDSAALEDVVRGLGGAFNARVVVLQVIATDPVTLAPLADSAGVPGGLASNPVALAAAKAGTARARVTRNDVEYAESAAQVLSTQLVLLFSSSLNDQLRTVALVERRLAYATIVALAIVLSLGSIAAAVHARRIRRLERAANRIAQGSFDEPVIDLGDDELGQLAEAFDRMRIQLAQLDTARKEFVANASHELRTPLFSLAGFLELMADEELDEETRTGFLATTREQVERLSALAADLLDLSRIDAGRLRVEREEVSLSELARNLADELQPVSERSGRPLRAEATTEVWALADEERVLQIARALARNAVVHTPVGTQVTIRARSARDEAQLEVEDDGPGIPPEHRVRIFDRFYRVEGSRASGSGLGLAIAREVAAQMGGEVSVESRPGRTVFTLTLPADPLLESGRTLATTAS